MTIVDKYLKELALSNRRVIIPDLGAFLLKDNADNTKSIIFSSFLKFNDGFLEEKIAEKSQLTKQEISSVINKFVNDIKHAIYNKQQYEINGFGYFISDEKGAVCFNPYKSSFDTSHKNEAPIEVKNNIDPIEKPVPDNILQQKISAAAQLDSKHSNFNISPQTENKRSDDNINIISKLKKEERKKRKRLLWVIVFLIIIIIFLSTVLYLCLSNGSFYYKKAVTSEPPQIIKPSNIKTNVINIDSSKMLIYNSASNINGVLYYYVVAGCFVEKINADRFVQYLMREGYTSAVILQKIGDMYPVSIAKTSIIEEAQQIQADYNSNNYEEAWIYKTY
jgi:hypothetical protein